MIHEDSRVSEAGDRCARLEAWMSVENDPAKREEIAAALKDARETFKAELERFAKEKAEREAAEKAKDGKQLGSVTDIGKHLDKFFAERAAEADRKAQAEAAAAAAEREKANEAKAGATAAEEKPAPELERLRELEPPREIQELPEFKATYEAELEKYTAAAEAAALEFSAAGERRPEDTPELEKGAEVRGEVETIVKRDDVTVYIVRDDDGVLTALHDDPKDPKFPDLDAGDRIDASRDQDGDYSVSYDNGYDQ